jgi:GntR family transcriptional repressor for pyruvate dehydrogenase complex
MQEMQRQRADDFAYEQLLANIRENVWKPGEKLPPEPELCDMLNVSRVTVRSAIQRLRAIGIIEVKQGKGTFVVGPENIFNTPDFNPVLDITEKEFNDMNDLREAIETKAILIISKNRDTVDLSAVERAYFGMKEALKNKDFDEYTKQDFLFHLSIIIATRNEFFIQLMSIFKNQYYKYFHELNKFMLRNDKYAAELMQKAFDPNESHTLLYQFLCKNKPAKIEQLVATFISGNKKRFIEYLRERDLRKQK